MTRAGRTTQSGAASGMLVVVTPVLLLLLTVLFQLVAWEQADHVAHLAARRAADAARLLNGTAQAGRTTANDTLAHLGSAVLVAPTVAVSRDGTTVSAEVSGYAESLVPWLRLPVDAVARGSVERFVAPGSGP